MSRPARLTLVLLPVLLFAGGATVSPFGVSSSAATVTVTTTALPVIAKPDLEPFVAVDPVGKHVFVAGGKGTSAVFVLDFYGNLVKTISGEAGAAGMAVDTATHTLYVADFDATAIAEINTQTLVETARFSTAPYSGPYNLALAGGKLWFATDINNDGIVGSASLDGTNLANSGLIATPGGPGLPVFLTASADGTLLAFGSHEDHPPDLEVYDVSGATPTRQGSPMYPGSGPDSTVSDLAFDPSGNNLLLATGSPYFLQEQSTSTYLETFSYPTGPYPNAVAVSSDGNYVAASNSSSVLLYPWDNATSVGSWDIGAFQHSLAFSPDGRRLFALSRTPDGNLAIDVIDLAGDPPQTLTVTKAGSGSASGRVTSLPAGINCGSTCAHSYAYGRSVQLKATPAIGTSFDGWTGGCSGTGSCTVAMDKARAVTASFTKRPPASLKVSRSGHGTVTSRPSGISCGSTCSHVFTYGTAVTLTAAPALGSVFTGWSGSCTGARRTCHVSMTAARTVTAVFAATKLLTVAKSGTGSGSVTSSPAGISCGAICTHAFAARTIVTLTASPKSGSTFTGWSGACSGTGNCVVSMGAARTLKATFTPTAAVRRTGR